MPTGETKPTPVTTTRLLICLSRRSPKGRSRTSGEGLLLLLGVRLDVVDRFLDAGDLFRFLVRTLDAELFLVRHHDFDGVLLVRAQVVDELRIRSHFHLVDAQLHHYNALHLVANRHVSVFYMYIPPLTARTCPVIYDASSEA